MKRWHGRPHKHRHAGVSSGRRPEHSRRANPERDEDVRSRSLPKQLPGFYYDAEKNRYFRLLPGHNRHNPLTRDVVNRSQLEKGEHGAGTKNSDLRPAVSMVKLLYDRQLGRISAGACCQKVTRKQLERFFTSRQLATVPWVFSMRMALDYSGTLLFACERNIHTRATSAHLYSLDHTFTSPRLNEISITYNPLDVCKALSWSPRSTDGLVLAQDAQQRFSHQNIEYAPAGLFHCQLAVDANGGPQLQSFARLKVSTRDIHDCVWDPSGARNAVLVAEERNTALFDIEQKKILSLHRHASDGLCLSMSKSRPIALCGLRNGWLSLLDMRMKKAGAVLLRGLHHQPLAISKVQLLREDQVAMVASLDNRLALWDVRTSGKLDCAVCSFKEHRNADNLKLAASVYHDRWLAASGQDNRVRVWDTVNGELLHTISAPADCDVPLKPINDVDFQWAPSWPGHSSPPGLLIRWPSSSSDDRLSWHGGTLV